MAAASSMLCLHQASINPIVKCCDLLGLIFSPLCNGHGRSRPSPHAPRCSPGQGAVWFELIGWVTPKLSNHSVKWSWTCCQVGSSAVTLWTVEPNQHVRRWGVNERGRAVMCQAIHIADHSEGEWRFNTPVGWLPGHGLQGNVWTCLLLDRSRPLRKWRSRTDAELSPHSCAPLLITGLGRSRSVWPTWLLNGN